MVYWTYPSYLSGRSPLTYSYGRVALDCFEVFGSIRKLILHFFHMSVMVSPNSCFLFFRIFQNFSKNFRFWLGGAAPQTPRILAGGASPPQSPPLTGLAGGLPPPGPPAFFFSPLTTRAPPGRTAGRPAERPPEPKKLSRCASYDSEYDFTIPFFLKAT